MAVCLESILRTPEFDGSGFSQIMTFVTDSSVIDKFPSAREN